MDPINCEECSALIGYGAGDLNCLHFLCPSCFEKVWKEPIDRIYEEIERAKVSD